MVEASSLAAHDDFEFLTPHDGNLFFELIQLTSEIKVEVIAQKRRVDFSGRKAPIAEEGMPKPEKKEDTEHTVSEEENPDDEE